MGVVERVVALQRLLARALAREHAAQAVDRYRTDKVKKPERQRTSRSITGGGGSGGGGEGQ